MVIWKVAAQQAIKKNAERKPPHRKTRSRWEATIRPKFHMKKDTEYEDLILRVEGRADGIFTQNEKICIDEIKGVYKNLELLAEPVLVHRAQALCYAWSI